MILFGFREQEQVRVRGARVPAVVGIRIQGRLACAAVSGPSLPDHSAPGMHARRSSERSAVENFGFSAWRGGTVSCELPKR